MNSLAKSVPSMVSVCLALAFSGGVSAQPAQPPNGGSVQDQANKEARQEQFDRDKITLRDRVQAALGSTGAQTDALRRMASANDPNKQRDDELQKRLSETRDRLKDDLSKIDDSTIASWPAVRSMADGDLAASNFVLRQASPVTKAPAPAASGPRGPSPAHPKGGQ